MRRKITEELEAWKSQPQKKPLVILGARQVGKTTSVLEFAHAAYDHVVDLNFYMQPELQGAFRASLEPDGIIAALEAILQIDIAPQNTLLFFDEVQACDEALTSLKFFAEKAPEYDLIAAGSLLGVHVSRHGSFPVGYVELLTMHPMDFEEFCWAMDEERAFELVKKSFDRMTACPVHERMLSLYRSYLMVGGMPEAVKTHVTGERLQRVRAVQQSILEGYLIDIAKYANPANAAKIIATWESMPAQLAKESGSTKFVWKEIARDANANRYGSSVDWLVAAGLLNKCVQVSEGMAPLRSFENTRSFKLYLEDIGLLACEYDATEADLDGKGHRTARFRGGIAENYVMQQLVAQGLTAYYWGQQSTAEVDFVVRLHDGVVPIEVKSGEHARSTSAQRFAKKYDCPYVIRISAKDFGCTDEIHAVPLYAACLIGALEQPVR